jgi:outer membrane receptor protein involved in Fe transport
MANFGKVRTVGVDLTAATEVSLLRHVSLSLQAAYTWQKTEDRLPNSPSYGRQLPYTPKHSGNASALLCLPWFNLGYTVLMQGERWSMPQTTPLYRLKPYWEQTLTLTRDFPLRSLPLGGVGGGSLRLQLSLQNLTDEQYEIIQYYPMPGRQFVATATLKI